MRHSLDGLNPNTEIQVTETEQKTCLITSFEDEINTCIELDIKNLHSFIGTLLHVQQKLKNR